MRLISTPLKGKPVALNLLRAAARDRRILFMDADVLVPPGTFDLLLTALAIFRGSLV